MSFSPYTDLALEAAETLSEDLYQKEGIEVSVTENETASVTTVKITEESGAKRLGKPLGTYITIESEYMRENTPELHEEIKKLLADSLAELCKLNDRDSVLVVGLGNRYVTPDSLGPKVIGGVMVTRHIKNGLPNSIKNKVREVSAVTPGVMGLTGIESSEIIKGIAEKTHPSLIIAIDALAARRANRINSTIQLADTGVTPGAGVGNTRGALNEETMNTRVVAVGVPTVVDAATLVNDSLNAIIEDMFKAYDKEDNKVGKDFYDTLKQLDSEEKYSLISSCLDPYTGNMFVTPKEVDEVTDTLANIISDGINMALHKGINKQNVNLM